MFRVKFHHMFKFKEIDSFFLINEINLLAILRLPKKMFTTLVDGSVIRPEWVV